MTYEPGSRRADPDYPDHRAYPGDREDRDRPRSRPRRGAHLGPFAITPVRVFVPLALVGSLAYVAYAVSVRDAAQIPALALGAGALGVVFVVLALAGVSETIRAGRRGSAGRSVIAAIFGGVAGIIAFGCFAAAVLLVMLSQTPLPT
jgi:hypothetical protein